MIFPSGRLHSYPSIWVLQGGGYISSDKEVSNRKEEGKKEQVIHSLSPQSYPPHHQRRCGELVQRLCVV